MKKWMFGMMLFSSNLYAGDYLVTDYYGEVIAAHKACTKDTICHNSPNWTVIYCTDETFSSCQDIPYHKGIWIGIKGNADPVNSVWFEARFNGLYLLKLIFEDAGVQAYAFYEKTIPVIEVPKDKK